MKRTTHHDKRKKGALKIIFSSSSPLLNRIILRTFIIALGFCCITIGLTFYAGYRYQISEVKKHLESLFDSQHEVLINNIWNFDTSSVKQQLNGMLIHPDIYHIELKLENNQGLKVGTLGKEGGLGHTTRYKLFKETGSEREYLGELSIFVTYYNVIKRVRYGYLALFGTFTCGLLVICVLIYLLFHKLFYRHLNQIVTFAEDLNINTLDKPLCLERKRPQSSSGDELQLIADAFNNMRRRLLEDIRENEALREDRSLLEQVIEQSANATLITDEQWQIRYVNKALLKRMACTPKEPINSDLSVFLGLSLQILSYDAVAKVVRSGLPWRTHIAGKINDTQQKEENIKITAIQTEGGSQSHFVVVIVDVTKEWVLEKRLLQVKKMESIGTLAGGIAHDFNNLLSVILGYAELIQVKTKNGAFLAEIGRILQAGNRAKELVNQILTFSRETDVEFKPILLQSILREVEGMLSASLPASITFTMDIDDTVPAVSADGGQLHQVVMNLCTNAKQALIDETGTIDVSLKMKNIEGAFRFDNKASALQPGKYACLTVRDNGCGMDESTLLRIFDPFYSTKAHEGTGLGLSVVHGIIRKHKGEINVTSTPGEGTLFQVFLPTADIFVPVGHVEGRGIQGGTERVMIVDDESAVLELLDSCLTVLGYNVTTFQSPEEALHAFVRHPDEYDVVITDMVMPGMTGDMLTAKLKAVKPQLPVILCTGYSENMDEKRAAAVGINKFIMKPLVTRELAGALREVLAPKKNCHDSLLSLGNFPGESRE